LKLIIINLFSIFDHTISSNLFLNRLRIFIFLFILSILTLTISNYIFMHLIPSGTLFILIITNLISTNLISRILKIGFSINNSILNRFFSFHFILLFIIFLFIIFHLFFLHLTGSSNLTGINRLVTLAHIQTEWYFIFAYAILRSIPKKL
ncbi:Cytochrome b, partial [Atta colombica]